jgi:hypothetical protein
MADAGVDMRWFARKITAGTPVGRGYLCSWSSSSPASKTLVSIYRVRSLANIRVSELFELVPYALFMTISKRLDFRW